MSRKSISVEFWNSVFYFLGRLSAFAILYPIARKNIRNKSDQWWYDFVDIWVLGHLGLSILAVFLVSRLEDHWLSYIIVGYGFLRVFEIVIYQVNVLLFDEYRARKRGVEYKIRGYRRMIVNLFNNFGEIMFWFGSSYVLFATSLHDSHLSIPAVLFNSFSVMTTFGVSELQVKTEAGLAILWFQSTSGLLMSLLSISRFIGLLPKVESIDEFEN